MPGSLGGLPEIPESEGDTGISKWVDETNQLLNPGFDWQTLHQIIK